MKQLSMILSILLCLVYACSEEPNGQTPTDDIAPGVITNVHVEPQAGGALITYDLPDDEDLLCVKAMFQLIDGKMSEEKASVYSSELEIMGFGDTLQRDIQLVTIDRSYNESEPVSVSVKPISPPFVAVQKSLTLSAAFGGIDVKMENPSSANVIICVDIKDEKGDYINFDKIYTQQAAATFKIRGMQSVESDLRYYVTDRWGNTSDVSTIMLTPMFEIRIPSSHIEPMAEFTTEFAWGWQLPGLFDDNSGTGFHTDQGTGEWPHHFVFAIDEGPIKVSRIRVIQRDGFEFQHGMPRNFTLYGSNEYPTKSEFDYSNWTKIGDFESQKPSGLPIGQNTNEDVELARSGEDFDVTVAPSFKYFRVDVTKSWSGQPFICFMEFQLFGDPEGFDFTEE